MKNRDVGNEGNVANVKTDKKLTAQKCKTYYMNLLTAKFLEYNERSSTEFVCKDLVKRLAKKLKVVYRYI